MVSISWRERDWPLKEPFVIARGSITVNQVLEVELRDGTIAGRGEGYPIDYAGETRAGMVALLQGAREAVSAGASRNDLLRLLPAGGARCALDAAYWDLEAKRDGQNPFTANDVLPQPVVSARTIGIRETDSYERTARDWRKAAVLKVKVDGGDPISAIEAVRRGAPDARLIVDPNQGWSVEQTRALAPRLSDLGVALLEQPIPVGHESQLEGWECPVPLCADELVDDESDLGRAQGRFAYINIKLDKAGGLTAAMALARTALARGFRLMVGCMGGSSLAMAPGMVLAQLCEFVDLDGPLYLTADRADGFDYRYGAIARPHHPELWG